MDAVDKKIIDVLKENGKLTTYQIAKKMNMSWVAINIRLMKLKASGLVKTSEKQMGANKKIFWEAV